MIKGFSLLELLVALSISAILLTLALPCYTHYLDKIKFKKLLLDLETYKFKIVELSSKNVEFKSAVYVKPLPFVDSVILRQQRDNYRINAQINSAKFNTEREVIVEFWGSMQSDFLVWDCFISSNFIKLAPVECRELKI